MNSRMVLALFLLGSVAALKVDFSESAWREKPIQKVVKLLKEMQEQIQKEGEEDAEMYEKMGCWCETNDREKTEAIRLAGERVVDLTAAIPEYAAKAATNEVDIKQLKKQVAQNKEALAKATEVRAKEQEEFRTNEKDMLQSVASLKNAVRVMGDVHSGALDQESLIQVQQVVRHHMEQHKHVFKSLNGDQHELVLSLLQGPAVTMLQSRGKQLASGAIFGILKQMKEDFEKNMKTSAEDEAESKSKFEAMEEAKKTEIQAGKDQIDNKKIEMAEAIQKNAQSKEDLEDTNAQLKADQEFLQNLKLKCQKADHEFEQRTKTRNEELQAVSETIGIITDDDAKETLNKATMFMQVSSRSSRSRKVALRAAAALARYPKFSALAYSMRNDAFAEVKKNIDTMVKALKEEQAEEIKQQDYCVKEIQENEVNQAEKSSLKDDLTQKIQNLDSTTKTLTEAIATLKQELADTQVEMKRASENREKQNHEFQTVVSEQRATQAILAKALDKLKSFYAAAAASASLVQEDQVSEPLAFIQYKKNGGASGVLAMIETIVDDSKTTEKEAMEGESDSQSAYESFMKDSSDSVEALSKDVANKSQELAKADGEMITAEDDAKHTVDDMLTLAEVGQQLHKQCDFLIKNFGARQEARAGEIEALNSAKAIFNGVSM